MKNLVCILFIAFMTMQKSSLAQGLEELTKKIEELDTKVKQQEETIENLKRINNPLEYYENSLKILRSGLETGREMEPLAIESLNLITFTELVVLINNINNPAAGTLGEKFETIVIDAASEHLLSKFSSSNKDKAKSKFKTILKNIYEFPLIQGLLNSNPITNTINNAILVAGNFQKSQIKINSADIKKARKNKSADIIYENPDGMPFDENDLKNFSNSIDARMSFYKKFLEHSNKQKDTIQSLYIDAKIISNTTKVSNKEICKLLNIPINNSQNELNTKYADIPNNQKLAYLKDANFKKAIELSIRSTDLLPEIKAFNLKVKISIALYIKGYISILEEYINDDAKITSAKMDKRSLTTIKEQFVKIQSQFQTSNSR